MFLASLDATSGSVIAKAERMRPSRSGSNQAFFCSSVANISSSSMLPVSGAAQLIASGANSGDHPVISARVAYSVTVKPWAGLVL